jgi:ABC-type spermidine/putrescine transport system permease subunit I
VPEIGAPAAQAEGTGRRLWRRRGSAAHDRSESGAWYPRWYWPSFALPGSLWLAILFVLPFYVVFAVAFGTVDFTNFGQPVPYYAPWWWSFETFDATLSKFYSGTAIYQPPLFRTFVYVFAATAICLVLGYTVAYFAARGATKHRGLILILLVSPLWISYLMRIYAWQGLLEVDGPINFLLGPFGFGDTNWLEGLHVTVILGLVYGYIPFMILPIYASLDRIQESLLEAGRDLGASGRQTFWRVTLPLSRPAILAGIVIVTLPMFGDYYTNNLLSGSPRTTMIGNILDDSINTSGQGPEAAIFTMILMVILIIPMLYYLRSTARDLERR